MKLKLLPHCRLQTETNKVEVLNRVGFLTNVATKVMSRNKKNIDAPQIYKKNISGSQLSYKIISLLYMRNAFESTAVSNGPESP